MSEQLVTVGFLLAGVAVGSIVSELLASPAPCDLVIPSIKDGLNLSWPEELQQQAHRARGAFEGLRSAGGYEVLGRPLGVG